MNDARELLPLAIEAVDLAAEIVRSTRPAALTAKSDRDMASDVDVRVERETRAYLAERAPRIRFVGEEEGGPHANGDLCWLLDPIDGTANYVKDLPLSAVSLALTRGDQVLLGVVAAPFLRTRYHAAAGQGAYEGNRRLQVRQTEQLRDAIVAIGDYSVSHDSAAKNRARLAVTEQLAERAQRVRMLGSIALDLTWLADGKLDASITLSNSPCDMAAGTLVAREAGAAVVDRDGSAYSLTSGVTIAAPQALIAELLAIVRTAEYAS